MTGTRLSPPGPGPRRGFRVGDPRVELGGGAGPEAGPAGTRGIWGRDQGWILQGRDPGREPGPGPRQGTRPGGPEGQLRREAEPSEPGAGARGNQANPGLEPRADLPQGQDPGQGLWQRERAGTQLGRKGTKAETQGRNTHTHPHPHTHSPPAPTHQFHSPLQTAASFLPSSLLYSPAPYPTLCDPSPQHLIHTQPLISGITLSTTDSKIHTTLKPSSPSQAFSQSILTPIHSYLSTASKLTFF